MTERSQYAGNLDKVLDGIRQLPSLPGLVVELLENFGDENVNIATLANKIAHDQALVARLMRVANSPFYGVSGQIGSISEAIAMLGFTNVRGLVLTAGLINVFTGMEKYFDWRAFWRHNVAAAVCAKLLAGGTGLNPDAAFTAGLLHDIGKLVMWSCFPHDVARLGELSEESGLSPLQLERETFGFDHTLLGSEVAKRWNFPVDIQHAIALHHTHYLPGGGKTMADVIYTANLLAETLQDDEVCEARQLQVNGVAWSRLKLDGERLAKLTAQARRQFQGTMPLLSD
ncbi:HDOD domain-containing protein [Methylococcaceae bacterium WWC4]|nr:HDOD domain-containing protein [Methylococcaceae bacterium WWC4]